MNCDRCIQKVYILENLRNFIWQQTETLSCEEFNFIPEKFNNNIIWNLGHLNSVLQKLTYQQSALFLKEDDSHFFSPFLFGTKPTKFYDKSMIGAIKASSFRLFDQLKIDLRADLFQVYQPSPMIAKVYGIEVLNINDALDYLIYHEGIHAACISNLKKLI